MAAMSLCESGVVEVMAIPQCLSRGQVDQLRKRKTQHRHDNGVVRKSRGEGGLPTCTQREASVCTRPHNYSRNEPRENKEIIEIRNAERHPL
jgi:hypothetical protein